MSACEYSSNPLCDDVNLPYYSRTPWLTTRRRTCPICKGDVVRSIGNRSSNDHGPERHDQMGHAIGSYITETRNDSLTSTMPDRKSTRLNSSHTVISYAVFC